VSHADRGYITLGHEHDDASVSIPGDQWTVASFRKAVSHLNQTFAYACDSLGKVLAIRCVWSSTTGVYRLEWDNYRHLGSIPRHLPTSARVDGSGTQLDQSSDIPDAPLVSAGGTSWYLRTDIVYLLNEVYVSVNLAYRRYELLFHKILCNTSDAPVNRVLYHFLANAYPADPRRSALHYQTNPVEWSALGVRAWDNIAPLDITLLNDHGPRKDFLILFSSEDIERPLLPGDTRELWYAYEVSMRHWGPYIDRPIMFPTRLCRVELRTPHDCRMLVGGYELSPVHEARLLNTRIREDSSNDEYRAFIWESDRLQLGRTYQINWSAPDHKKGSSTKATTRRRTTKVCTTHQQVMSQT